jgi:hypothetical protein
MSRIESQPASALLLAAVGQFAWNRTLPTSAKMTCLAKSIRGREAMLRLRGFAAGQPLTGERQATAGDGDDQAAEGNEVAVFELGAD